MREDQQKRKKELKELIKAEQKALAEFIMGIDLEEEKKLPEETQELNKTKNREIVTEKRLRIENWEEELKEVRMNRLGSSFTTFEATPPNRRMRKQLRKVAKSRTQLKKLKNELNSRSKSKTIPSTRDSDELSKQEPTT